MYMGMYSREAHLRKRQMFIAFSLHGNGLMHGAIIHGALRQITTRKHMLCHNLCIVVYEYHVKL
jgi:hypothetical protein